MHPLFHPLFLQFVLYFNEHQDYFECHEVLEEYWKSVSPNDKSHALTAWILLSTGMYHWRRGNLMGAERSLQNAQKRFAMHPESEYYTGIHMEDMLSHLKDSIEMIHVSKEFKPFTLTILSHEFKLLVQKQQMPVALTGEELIHKHMRRDRSEILKAREEKRRNRH
jgi:predicted metal-dependent hydrolase